MTTGERIRDLRKSQGMSQVALADKIGVSKQSMYKYEVGIVANIPYDKIRLIAEVCHTTPAYILGWEEVVPQTEQEEAQDKRLNQYFMSLYERLDDLDRGRLIGSAETMLAQDKYK